MQRDQDQTPLPTEDELQDEVWGDESPATVPESPDPGDRQVDGR